MIIIRKDISGFRALLDNPIHFIELSFVFIKSLIVISLIYYAIAYSIFQTTIGLKLLSYELKSADGTLPKIRQVLVRVLCTPISILLTLGLLGQNSIHDKFSKTKIVKV